VEPLVEVGSAAGVGFVPAAFAAVVLGAAVFEAEVAESPAGALEAFAPVALEPVVAVSIDDEAAPLLERVAGSIDATPDDLAAVGFDACPGAAPDVAGMPKPAGDLGASPAEEDFGVAAPGAAGDPVRAVAAP
jgi:hypothetical protein